MMLVIDAGNSRIKWGLRDGDAWCTRGALPIAEALRLRAAMPAGVRIERVVACCVAGGTVEAAIAAALGPWASHLFWLRSGAERQCGVRNAYRWRERLGVDRWAAAIGAWHTLGRECVVVMAGTATTIDLLRPSGEGGEFAGGVILPGLEMMRQALARNTAQLPEAHGSYVEFPRTTDDAIETGCIEAQVGAIARLATRLSKDAVCVLSGGAAPALRARIAMPVVEVEDLVLEGLVRIGAERIAET